MSSSVLPENQSKELVELLSQEGLGDVGLSSPSEQVAYLLVERATLLERLEAAERRLDSQSLTGNLREVQLQVHRLTIVVSLSLSIHFQFWFHFQVYCHIYRIMSSSS